MPNRSSQQLLAGRGRRRRSGPSGTSTSRSGRRLLCGEVDRPLPIWLTTTMKYRSGSSAGPGRCRPAPRSGASRRTRSGCRIALSLASFSVAVGGVGELQPGDRAALLEVEVARGPVQLVRALGLGRVEVVLDHPRSSGRTAWSRRQAQPGRRRHDPASPPASRTGPSSLSATPEAPSSRAAPSSATSGVGRLRVAQAVRRADVGDAVALGVRPPRPRVPGQVGAEAVRRRQARPLADEHDDGARAQRRADLVAQRRPAPGAPARPARPTSPAAAPAAPSPVPAACSCTARGDSPSASTMRQVARRPRAASVPAASRRPRSGRCR